MKNLNDYTNEELEQLTDEEIDELIQQGDSQISMLDATQMALKILANSKRICCLTKKLVMENISKQGNSFIERQSCAKF